MAEQVLNPQQLARYNVNREGWEAIRQSLYDFQAYPAAGATQLTFFQLPVGQAGKTYSDTNMALAGQLPANQMFLVQSVELIFLAATPTVNADMPAAWGASAVPNSPNDEYIFRRSGNLAFNIGSKPYLQEGPLGRFPPKTHFQVDGALSDATTPAPTLATRLAWAYQGGRPYLLSPAEINLTANQNFNITLAWPEGVQAITNPARVGVVLDGILYRRPQ